MAAPSCAASAERIFAAVASRKIRVVEHRAAPRESRRRPNARRSSRRRLRRRAAPDCAARPGISRSASRRRRARWHSAPSSRGSPRARPRSRRCAPRSPSASARSGRVPAGATATRLHAIERDGIGRLAREIRAVAQAARRGLDQRDRRPGEHREMLRLPGERHARAWPLKRAVGIERDPCRPAAPVRPTSRLPAHSSPARDSSQPASSVSASGTAAA